MLSLSVIVGAPHGCRSLVSTAWAFRIAHVGHGRRDARRPFARCLW